MIISQAVIGLLAPQTLVSFVSSALNAATVGYDVVLDIPESIIQTLTDGVVQEVCWSDHMRSEVSLREDSGRWHHWNQPYTSRLGTSWSVLLLCSSWVLPLLTPDFRHLLLAFKGPIQAPPPLRCLPFEPETTKEASNHSSNENISTGNSTWWRTSSGPVLPLTGAVPRCSVCHFYYVRKRLSSCWVKVQLLKWGQMNRNTSLKWG